MKNMKLFIISFYIFLVCTLTSTAQTRKNSISIYTDIEIEAENFSFYGGSYERQISTNQNLQIFTGISKQDNFQLGIEYYYNKQLPYNYLSLILGAGLGIEHHSDESILDKNNYLLFRPLLGVSFNIPQTCFKVFTTYKPKFDIQKLDTFDLSAIVFGLKYMF